MPEAGLIGCVWWREQDKTGASYRGIEGGDH
jgi:hypothetical protein